MRRERVLQSPLRSTDRDVSTPTPTGRRPRNFPHRQHAVLIQSPSETSMKSCLQAGASDYCFGGDGGDGWHVSALLPCAPVCVALCVCNSCVTHTLRLRIPAGASPPCPPSQPLARLAAHLTTPSCPGKPSICQPFAILPQIVAKPFLVDCPASDHLFGRVPRLGLP